MARSILSRTGLFSEEEIKTVFSAIFYHSNKKEIHGPLDEILKDADVMQHCLFDPGYVSKKDRERFEGLCEEFGL